MANTQGDKHPSRRAYRDEYREAPARSGARMRDWRDGAAERLVGDPATVELWRGPSQINAEPIVLLAACVRRPGAGVNPKTGDMVQLYFLPQLVDPREAIDHGKDAAVCGSCPHRPSSGGDCYVNVAWAPRNLWRAWSRGLTPIAPPEVFEGAAIRFGAWGDPAAAPLSVLQPLVRSAAMHTGYTQRWASLDVAEWGWLMASVVDAEQAARAQALGWRTFRTVYSDSEPPTGAEVQCLADSDGVTCVACGACNGTSSARPSVWLPVHGFRAGRVHPRATPRGGE